MQKNNELEILEKQVEEWKERGKSDPNGVLIEIASMQLQFLWNMNENLSLIRDILRKKVL